MTRNPEGVCFHDDTQGFWTGTFVDCTSAACVSECIDNARQLQSACALKPVNGRVVAVRMTIDEEATAKLPKPEREPITWFMETIAGKVESLYGVADIIPLERPAP